MRNIFVFILAWFLTACGGPAQQYILSEPGGSVAALHHAPAQIGVDQVTVPAYLSGNKIPVRSAEGTLTFCDRSVWATPPEKGLTRHAIASLQKRFATPRVYRYPWDIERSSGVRLHVALNRFIYDEATSSVILEGSYFVETLRGTHRRAKLFATRVPVAKGETPLIVAAMNQAFGRLVADAARVIAHN